MECAAFLKKESLVNTISSHALMAVPSTRPLLHAPVASGLLPFQALFARNQGPGRNCRKRVVGMEKVKSMRVSWQHRILAYKTPHAMVSMMPSVMAATTHAPQIGKPLL